MKLRAGHNNQETGLDAAGLTPAGADRESPAKSWESESCRPAFPAAQLGAVGQQPVNYTRRNMKLSEYEYKGLMVEAWDVLRGDTSNWADRHFYLEIIHSPYAAS